MVRSPVSRLSYGLQIGGVIGSLIGLLFIVVGCSSPQSLDDAQLITIRLERAEDRTRFAIAHEIRLLEWFGELTFEDPERGTVIFTMNDYSAYQAYLLKHPHLLRPSNTSNVDWATLNISFRTQRALVKPDDLSVMTVIYFCDGGPVWGNRLISSDLMWRGRLMTSDTVKEIETALAAIPEPQEYEVRASYTYWAEIDGPRPLTTITLKPPPGDLCVALEKMNWPMPVRPTYGRQLRIDREAVAAVLGPLPRRILHRCKDGEMRLECN